MTAVKKLYLAGKMSGEPQFNFPLFDRTAEALRRRGYEIVSPAELDDPETRAAALASPDGNGDGSANGETWGDFLARDVKIVADEVDGVVVMYKWERSRGARLETFVATLCGKPVYYYATSDPLPQVPLTVLIDAWTGAFRGK